MRVATHTQDEETARARADRILGQLGHPQDHAAWLQELVRIGRWAEAQLGQEPSGTTMAGAWEEYVACRRRPQSGPATMETYHFYWNHFVAWAERRGIQRLGDLSPGQAELYAKELDEQACRATTTTRKLRFLRLVWRCLERGRANPWDGLRSVRHDEPRGHRALTDLEIGRLLAAAAGEYRTLLTVGQYTGLRLKDAALLRWDQIDQGRQVAVIQPAKTYRSGKVIEIPILPELAEALGSPRAAGYCMPGIAARYGRARWGVVTALASLFRRAGVGDSPAGKASFHSLRTTLQTKLDNALTPRQVSRAVLGHSGSAMSDTYSRMDAEVARAAIARALRPDGTHAQEIESKY